MLFFNKGNKSSKLEKKQSLKTVIMTAFTASALLFSTMSASAAGSFKLTTVYHVYHNQQYIGTVSDKEIVKKIVEEKEDKFKESMADLDLKFGSDIEYIKEQVFHSTANNNETVKKLESAIQLQAEASSIIIDGQPVVFLKNKETAEDVINQLKLTYVTQEQLNEVEARKAAPETELPPLAENETRILDVTVSKDVSFDTKKVTPDKIMSAEEAVTLLQNGTTEEKKYIVQEGDVLGTIANNHGLKLIDFLALNPELTEDTVVNIGQEVNVTASKPYLEVIVNKEVNQKEAIPYANETVNDESMPKGETKVKQEGKNGERSVNYQISTQNGTTISSEVTSEVVIAQPVNHIVVKGTKIIPSRGSGNLAWPTSGGYVSSQQGQRWGKSHKGIDIARPSNLTIKAADNGKVVSAGWDGGYGNKIIIDHQNGIRTVYAHLSSIDVSVGQSVSQGSAIGVMGSTGNSTGVHLHFEVYKDGALQNPLGYLK
ncbi:peptidoglycan DD-metalloendopeptidase family protein [Bacillus sp. OK048]|uniref:peptidoglycan DD-metalloendopeptidase family protein n=1 Tax=Bacillus sp. OK048 TaxID=1882761 RepID=UPI00088C4628|nr:M23 family metallopeptidase [Bacillus sp. OK048]SDM97989.1 Murein DD-endopeptidase MepM and murein hydrolase activator NlpD, contain LysM domain [Bacillus sp. OK048]